MGRKAYDDDNEVWTDFDLALSRCVYGDLQSVKAALLDFGLTVVRIKAVKSPGKMLQDALRKPMFKIAFVKDPSDLASEQIGCDFALTQIDAEAKANSELALYRQQGATGWRITDLVGRTVAIGPDGDFT